MKRSVERRTGLEASVAALWMAVIGVIAMPAAAADKAAEPNLRITRAKLKPNPAVVRGFAAFNAGDLATAELEYGQVLKSEPGNPDALHGLAAIALRRNNRESAEDFYRRAIEANPQDAIALAGLSELNTQLNPVGAESRLKLLIASQPNEPALHFALGNLYANAERWRDAQQAYFSAHTGSPDQPDYLFNLAVSLDHLRQTRLARDFYAKALVASRTHAARFDPVRASARLRELEQ